MKTDQKVAALKHAPELAQMRRRSEEYRARLAAAEGGAISTREAARWLHLSQSAVRRRWNGFRLIGWRAGAAIQFPRWQFASEEVLPGIEMVLQVFRSHDDWRIMNYFLGVRRSLDGRRPLDLLRSQQMSMVLDHARTHARNNTW